MTSLKSLDADQLEFVDNKVSHSFLKQFGTSTGFNEFCKVAVGAGQLKSCGTGVARNKQSYATYLLNSGNANLWNEMVDKYGTLDTWSKAGMAKQVKKGKGLSEISRKALSVGKVYGSCNYGRYTIPELKEMAESLNPKLARKDMSKMSKAELCAMVDGLMNGGQGGKEFWDLGTDKGEPIPWKDYPFKPKKKKEVKRYDI